MGKKNNPVVAAADQGKEGNVIDITSGERTIKASLKEIRKAVETMPAEIAMTPPNEQVGELWFDPKVAWLAEEVIRGTPEFVWLMKRTILVTMREGLGRHAAKIRKATEYEQMLTPVDVVLTVSDEVWQTLTERGKRALLSHELCHLSEDEDGRIKIVEHDFDGFVFEIEKYGPWNQPLIRMARQLELFGKLNGKPIPLAGVEGEERGQDDDDGENDGDGAADGRAD